MLQNLRPQETAALRRKCLHLRLLACALWVLIMLFLSLSPVPEPSFDFAFLDWDKLHHAVAYGLLAFLLARCLQQWRGPGESIGWTVWILAMLFGLLVEILQWAMDIGRAAEWFDVVANGVGVTLVCALLRHRWVQGFVQARTFDGRR